MEKIIQQTQPITLGLTGLIGSGKSTVAQGFLALGVPVYDSDKEAKRLMRDKLSDQTSAILGVNILDENGEINRGLVAQLIFSNNTLLEKINALVHPAVLEDFLMWRVRHSAATYCVVESAILYGSVLEQYADKVIATIAPVDVCAERAAMRDNVPVDAVVARMSKQLSGEELRHKADFVVDTTKLIMPQILEIL